jgi:hypothetical protein
MRSPLGIWGSIIGVILVSATVLHTFFATRINAIGGTLFFASLTAAYLYLKRRQAN